MGLDSIHFKSNQSCSSFGEQPKPRGRQLTFAADAPACPSCPHEHSTALCAHIHRSVVNGAAPAKKRAYSRAGAPSECHAKRPERFTADGDTSVHCINVDVAVEAPPVRCLVHSAAPRGLHMASAALWGKCQPSTRRDGPKNEMVRRLNGAAVWRGSGNHLSPHARGDPQFFEAGHPYRLYIL
eukprot:354169-Chlamydomonas_euryale.AAC.23